ncbi:MAG: S-methyl-5-thioribose-1-phosphate isomerase [Pirellulaceae bacterium]|nr:S-methyl-5-thioribose-1-phosphate isomerase [Pirellulaceae bacterium]
MRWIGETHGSLELLDQTKLPATIQHLQCQDVETVWEAIKMLRVRGAPAIGIAAAYGICLGIQDVTSHEEGQLQVISTAEYLATSRPTAVNLFWALDRMKARAVQVTQTDSATSLQQALLVEAIAIHDEDRQTCHAIGKFGAELMQDGQGVLTHCNAGGLATAEYGTALSVFFTAQDLGKTLHVYVDETRPLLQGARLTAWELMQRKINTTLICDSMAAQVMREGRVSAVVTGADRIAANGDTANKIGTYAVAVLAQAHGLPFYVAAPCNTFDLTLASGEGIPIEERDATEITSGFGKTTAPEGVQVYNPAFDVTPAELVTAIITERGIIDPVNRESIAAVVAP